MFFWGVGVYMTYNGFKEGGDAKELGLWGDGEEAAGGLDCDGGTSFVLCEDLLDFGVVGDALSVDGEDGVAGNQACVAGGGAGAVVEGGVVCGEGDTRWVGGEDCRNGHQDGIAEKGEEHVGKRA